MKVSGSCQCGVERSKPHPDIFVAALNRLELPAEDVVVGDTLTIWKRPRKPA